jgi:hypothetical protein
MSGDWLDRAARAADERVSRRRLLQQAGVAALTVGPLGALLRAAPARAETPCLPQCQQAVGKYVDRTAAACWGLLGSFLVAPGAAFYFAPASLGFGCAFGLAYGFPTEDARCRLPNCGNPPGPPPPPPPPAPAPPAVPPQYPDPFWPRQEKKRKRIKKKKKPPAPCGDVPCTGADKCCPSTLTSSGFICCASTGCCNKAGTGCAFGGDCK